jgi:hypothetical protein
MDPTIVIIALTDPFVLATLFAIRETACEVPDNARALAALEVLADMGLVACYGNDEETLSIVITGQGWKVIGTYNDLVAMGAARRELSFKAHARIRGEFYQGRKAGPWYQAAIDNTALDLEEWAIRTAKEELSEPVRFTRVG